MNLTLSRRAVIALAIAITLLLLPSASDGGGKHGEVRLNAAALDYAQKLIADGHVVADNHGAWREHKVSKEQENEFIRQHGFDEYAKWHLGIDERHAENSKARYKFPYGDFENVHRCALLAVKSRAAQYGHAEIEAAAEKLLAEIAVKTPKR